MTQSSKAASSRKRGGAAARSEGKAKPKSVKFHGLTLKLPDEMPGEIIFAMYDAEHAGNRFTAGLSLIEPLLGADQFAQMRGTLVAAGLPMAKMDQELGDLIESIFATYGLTPGE